MHLENLSCSGSAKIEQLLENQNDLGHFIYNWIKILISLKKCLNETAIYSIWQISIAVAKSKEMKEITILDVFPTVK